MGSKEAFKKAMDKTEEYSDVLVVGSVLVAPTVTTIGGRMLWDACNGEQPEEQGPKKVQIKSADPKPPELLGDPKLSQPEEKVSKSPSPKTKSVSDSGSNQTLIIVGVICCSLVLIGASIGIVLCACRGTAPHLYDVEMPR